MTRMLKRMSMSVLALLALVPAHASAHQPRIVTHGPVEVLQPEVSKAFYGELAGAPVEYRIRSEREFRLYVGLLVPDIPGARKDISADIYRVTGTGREPVAFLDATQSDWTPFFEKFAGNTYFWGPEFKADDSPKGAAHKGRTVPAGTYVINVFSPSNRGKYSLAIGDLESFPLTEIFNVAVTVPQVKRRFFGESWTSILASRFMLILEAITIGLTALVAWILRRVYLRLRSP